MHTTSRASRVRRLTAFLILPLCASSLAAELTLYPEDDYQGRALAVVINERHLGVLNFDDRASSVVIESGAWVLCSDQDYAGRCITLEPGRYPSLQALGLDHQITSVRRWSPPDNDSSVLAAGQTPAMHEAANVVLYAANQYRGASRGVSGAQFNLRSAPFSGAASSAVITNGNWELCSEPAFNGNCVTLGPGKYPSLQALGLAGAASMRRARESPHSVPAGAASRPPQAQ